MTTGSIVIDDVDVEMKRGSIMKKVDIKDKGMQKMRRG